MLSIKKFCAGLIVVTWGLTEKKKKKYENLYKPSLKKNTYIF